MTGKSPRPRTGGRPAQITLADITREGRRIGLAGLTVNGVATALGVTPTALYRHVDGKLGLERAVGESILAELRIVDDPAEPAPVHLLSFARQLRRFVQAHPGLAAYMQALFPCGESGLRLQHEAIEAIGRRGYDVAAAVMLSGTVATLTLSLTAADERFQAYTEGPNQRELHRVYAMLEADEILAAARRNLPEVHRDQYFDLVMTACIRGLTAVAPPGRSVFDVVSDLGGQPG